NLFRGWYAGCLQNGGRNIDEMVELPANAAGVFDASRPGDGHALANAAEIAWDLLGPLEGRAERPRPTNRKNRVGLVGAQGVVPLHLLRRRQLNAVPRQHPVERAVRSPFGGSAVVAADVDDQSIVELAQVFDRLNDPPDFMVGVGQIRAVNVGL